MDIGTDTDIEDEGYYQLKRWQATLNAPSQSLSSPHGTANFTVCSKTPLSLESSQPEDRQ